MVRKIIVYKNNFTEFYKSQENKIQEKIGYVLDLVRFEKQIPIKFFKYLDSTDGKGELIVLTNCFLKKSQKTPRKEIELAERLKKEYMIEKYGGR